MHGCFSADTRAGRRHGRPLWIVSTIDPHPPALERPAFADSPGSFAVDVVPLRLSDLSTGALDAWDRLADRAAEPNPFFRREFVQAASQAFDTDPLLLIGASGGEWVLCLPIDSVSRWRRLAMPCLAPWMPDVTFLSTPLVDRDHVEGAARGLAGYLSVERQAAALVLDPVDPDGEVGRALGDAFLLAGREPVIYAEWERGALHRRPEPTYVEEAMSAKRRKELRRLRRSLGRDLGGEVELVDRSSDPDACDEFMRIESAGWKGAEGTALASSPQRKAFFRSMCRDAAAAGRLQMLSLECAGRTVAMQCNLIDGDALFGFKVAYYTDFARHSPGALLEVDAIGFFHETEGLDVADSCASGDSEMINRIWPDRRRMQTLIVPTASRRAALIEPNLAAEAFARRVAHATRARWARARKP
jgi:CelD/BcsL family acetyltransferase involved in cellulose biosynthesis